MNIALLTSSRADFGIYLPLIHVIEHDEACQLTIIAFGTHGSPHYGRTLREIEEKGFKNVTLINSLVAYDDENAISTSYGLTVLKFADYWAQQSFDLVFCLGDRFEMAAAVQAGIPFGIRFAHLHGGETTLGAIDNIYRHQIALASQLHFTSTKVYADRVQELIGANTRIYNVGALSLDGIEEFEFAPEGDFRNKFGLGTDEYLLVTMQPETVAPENNKRYAVEFANALEQLAEKFTICITMPNADTNGSLYRTEFIALSKRQHERIVLIESFGKVNYFHAMRYANLMVGNTSSGIVEAASFRKYVVNVGSRQKGRVRSENVIDCEINCEEIISAVHATASRGEYKGSNVYSGYETAKNILKISKEVYATL